MMDVVRKPRQAGIVLLAVVSAGAPAGRTARAGGTDARVHAPATILVLPPMTDDERPPPGVGRVGGRVTILWPSSVV
jgi:hypothetical protein